MINEFVKTSDGVQIFLQGLGSERRAAACLPSRLAPLVGRLGQPDALLRRQGLSRGGS